MSAAEARAHLQALLSVTRPEAAPPAPRPPAGAAEEARLPAEAPLPADLAACVAELELSQRHRAAGAAAEADRLVDRAARALRLLPTPRRALRRTLVPIAEVAEALGLHRKTGRVELFELLGYLHDLERRHLAVLRAIDSSPTSPSPLREEAQPGA